MSNYDFEKGDDLSDVKLRVEERTFYVHKAILATVSPVFMKMFTLDFKEKSENLVNLPNKRATDILELLKLIYPNYDFDLDDVEDDKLARLLELSEEFMINKLKISIEKHLINKVKNQIKSPKKLYGKEINNKLVYLSDLLRLSMHFVLNKLKQECIETIATNFDKNSIEELFVQSEFIDVDECTKLNIFKKKCELLENKLKTDEKKYKNMQDEMLRQKFEIQHLKNMLEQQNQQDFETK